MTKNNYFNYRNVLMSSALILIVGLFSCTNSGTTTSSNVTDSNYTDDNTLSGANGANGNTNAQNSSYMTDGSGVNGTNDGLGSASTNNSSNNSIDADTTFIMKAAEIDMEEIKLGKLAQQKGTSAHVKELGKMMVAEHTQAMKALNPLAKAKTITLPAKESSKIMDAYKTLSSKSGKEFDKAYSNMMVDGHKAAISLFEQTNNNTRDVEIKALTTAMLPKLKTHLEHAEICKKECE